MFVLLQVVSDSTARILIIVGTSMVFLTLQSLTFLIPYCAKITKSKAIGYYLVIIRSVIAVVLSSIICYGLKMIFNPTGWLMLIVSGMITCITCCIVSLCVILNKNDRETVFIAIKNFTNKLLRRK